MSVTKRNVGHPVRNALSVPVNLQDEGNMNGTLIGGLSVENLNIHATPFSKLDANSASCDVVAVNGGGGGGGNEAFDCAYWNKDRRKYMDRVVDLNIDYLYQCMFTYNEFYDKFSKKRRIRDFKKGEWQTVLADGGELVKMRVHSYLVGVNTFGVGGSIKNITHEKVVVHKPSELYIMDSENSSEGLPYADSFNTNIRFCLVRASDVCTRITMYATHIYLKKVNFLIKAFIDRNVPIELSEYCVDLNSSLIEECENVALGGGAGSGGLSLLMSNKELSLSADVVNEQRAENESFEDLIGACTSNSDSSSSASSEQFSRPHPPTTDPPHQPEQVEVEVADVEKEKKIQFYCLKIKVAFLFYSRIICICLCIM